MNEQNFTEKTATFKGEYFNMLNFLNSGIKYASKKTISGGLKNTTLKITWICENPDEDIQDLIDIEQVELWDIDIIEINNAESNTPKKSYLCALCDGVPCHKDCEDCNK